MLSVNGFLSHSFAHLVATTTITPSHFLVTAIQRTNLTVFIKQSLNSPYRGSWRPRGGEERHSSTISLTLALNGGGWLLPCPSRLDPVPIIQDAVWAPWEVRTGADNLIPSVLKDAIVYDTLQWKCIDRPSATLGICVASRNAVSVHHSGSTRQIASAHVLPQVAPPYINCYNT